MTRDCKKVLLPMVLLLAGQALGRGAAAGELTGEELMQSVNERPRGGDSRMKMEMVFKDKKRGDFLKTTLRLNHELAEGPKTIYRMIAPAHEEGIGLLIAEDASPPGMWMYFPISDHLVRVASRGLSALASDFSCEDLLSLVPLEDYEFKNLGAESRDGHVHYKVEMTPISQRLQRELGFSKAVGWIREDIRMITYAEYYDAAGKPFKTFHIDEVEEIDGVWTARSYSMYNHRAEHGTDVRLVDVEYHLDLSADLFVPERLAEKIP